MPPIIDRPPWQVMGSLYNPRMLAQDLPFGSDNDPFWVNPQAHRPIGKGCRHAVAVTLEVHEAGWRHALGVLDKTIEGPPQRHQAGSFGGMHLGDGAGQNP